MPGPSSRHRVLAPPMRLCSPVRRHRSTMNVSVSHMIVLAVVAAVCVPTAVSGAVYFQDYTIGMNQSDIAIPPSPPESTDTSTSSSAGTETTTEDAAAEKDCSSQIGTIQNGVPVNTMRKYDLEKILEEHGGAPGKLNVTWNKDVAELPVEDPKEQPLPDTDNSTFYVYNYKHTDFKTFIRLEHGLLRHKGQKDEYVDIRGELYWTPPDFCQKSRHATYRVDPLTGFSSEVTLEYCWIDEQILGCAWPANCQSNETYIHCVAAPSSALLASLVG